MHEFLVILSPEGGEDAEKITLTKQVFAALRIDHDAFGRQGLSYPLGKVRLVASSTYRC